MQPYTINIFIENNTDTAEPEVHLNVLIVVPV